MHRFAGWIAQIAWLLIASAGLLHASGPRARAAEAPLNAVRERVIANDPNAALALIQALPPELAGQVDVRYLAARLYESSGNIAQALISLPSDLSQLPDGVLRDVNTRRALWLARTGKFSQARPLLLALIKAAPDTELSLRAAECALAEGAAADALAILREVHGAAEKNFALRVLLARALVVIGDKPGAIRELRALYVERPEHARIGEVTDELRRLGDKQRFSDDDRLDRAERLLNAVRPADTLRELALLQAPKAKDRRARQLHLRGMALFRSRAHYAEAARVLAQAAAIGSGDLQASDAYHAARALARADHDSEAVKAYRAFAKRYPDSHFVSDALHDAAWLELRHDLPDGEPHMLAFSADAEKRADHDAAQSALWELAFHAFEHDQFAQALSLFERYATTSSSATVRARGLYWAGRSALLSGNAELGRKHLREALAIEPLHWYALLAAARLRELNEPVADPFEPPAPSQVQTPDSASITPTAVPAVTTPEPALPAEVEFYAHLGLLSDASAALHKAEDNLRAASTSASALPSLVRAYQQLDEYARPYRLVEREPLGTLQTRPNPDNRIFWDALFPRPYLQDVTRLTAQDHLPDDFVYAIMRRESAYDPTVVSSADAVGLLQLIEPTAKLIARETGVTPFKRTMLFDPPINLRLGARYLADLLALYHGQIAPAVAAYNAGEHRVNAWLTRAQQRHGTIELDRFVEDIPIDQTRNYVRGVIANWARYRYLADPKQIWPIALPLVLTR